VAACGDDRNDPPYPYRSARSSFPGRAFVPRSQFGVQKMKPAVPPYHYYYALYEYGSHLHYQCGVRCRGHSRKMTILVLSIVKK
jgi:hypothetical protein